MKNKAMLIFGAVVITIVAALAFNTSQSTNAPATAAMEGNTSERSYSPSIGLDNAPVTIVEFFDPACEACKAFYPFVKEILTRHPNDVRLVFRYAAFHEGSDTVIQMLEAARLQKIFQPVLEALLKDQNQWASHHNPNIDRAWELAQTAGLDVQQTREAIKSGKFDSLLKQENADIRALKVSQTPTFFVNKKPLESFGPDQLYTLVRDSIPNKN